MKNYKQPLLTILVIFATAYVLTIMGCAPSSNGSGNEQTDAPQAGNGQPSGDGQTAQPDQGGQLQQVDVKTMRECSAQEFATLQDWSTSLKASNDAIQTMGLQTAKWTLKPQIAQLATTAVKKCNVVQAYHAEEPCKKTRREITRPDVAVLVGAYDAARINDRCKISAAYLTKFNLSPGVSRPTPPKPAPTQPSQPMPQPDLSGGSTPVPSNLRQCTADEFTQLKTWRTNLDIANKNLASFTGPQTYTQNAINATTAATKSCEQLIAYHQKQPCAREKVYTGETLRDQCKAARAYYYDFAQRSESLISQNARLYFNTSVIANKTFRTGLGENSAYGNCMINNTTDQAITYTGQKALVTEARVYTNNAVEAGRNMFVFKTQEGLKFECYGLEYSSILTSKSEVVRLLSKKDTNVPLSYELN